MNKNVKTDCVYHGIADIQNFSTDWCILTEPYACPCEEEGYICTKYKSKIHEDGTATFEYRTTSRGTVDEYKCLCCGCYIYFPAYDTYASEKIDYCYCPYCGRPVEREE